MKPFCQFHYVHAFHGRPPGPRRKKKATEMTTEELAKKLFPKKVVDEVKRIAHEGEEEEKIDQADSSQDESST